MTFPEIVNPQDAALEQVVRARLDRLTKPPGSLGRLEDVVAWYCLARGEALPDLPVKELALFCGDHGVAQDGVSAYPQAVTAQMALNFAAGGAAINALCGWAEIRATVVDVGIAADLPADSGVVDRKIARGTRSFLREPAMTRDELDRALAAGVEQAEAAAERGCGLLLAGEMGIGNTASAAAVTCALTGLPPEKIVGRGTGVDDAGLARKTAAVARGLERLAPRGPLEALEALGGFEIAAMAGLYLGAAARRIPTVVDGFIASAAALAAVRLTPEVRPYLLFGHRSAESGHGRLLEALEARPLLDLEMRLGEGTGAALAAGLVDAALRFYREMATFEGASVSEA